MFLFAPRQIEGKTKHAVDSCSSEDCLLNYRFPSGPFVDSATDIGVFSLIVFADDGEVDIGGLPVLKRGLDTFQQSHRPQVDVLLKGTTNGNQ